MVINSYELLFYDPLQTVMEAKPGAKSFVKRLKKGHTSNVHTVAAPRSRLYTQLFSQVLVQQLQLTKQCNLQDNRCF